MGREWYSWGRSIERGEKESTGCMGGMLHYLDFQRILFSGSGGSCSNGGGRTPYPEYSSPSAERVNFSSEGVEAPRNSLELEVGKALMATTVDDEFHDIPVAVQLVMRTKKKSVELPSEDERRSSQAETPRTPSVVARLMGLDGLPEPPTPSRSAADCRKPHIVKEVKEDPQKKENNKAKSAAKKKKKKNEIVDESTSKESPLPPPMNLRKPLGSLSCNVAPALARERRDVTLCRSLPDTPRPSSARPWEVDPKRHSLQESSSSSSSSNNNNNNNNNNGNIAGIQHEFRYLCEVAGDYSVPPSVYTAKPTKELRKHFQDDENKSPRSHQYAHEIVNQAKENINRRRAAGEEILAKSKRTFRPAAAEKREVRNADVPPPPPPPFVPSPTIHSQKRRDHAEAKAIAVKRESYNARFTERIKKPPPPPSSGANAKTIHVSYPSTPSPRSPLNVARQSRGSTTKASPLQRSHRPLLPPAASLEEGKPPKAKCVGVLTQQDPEYGYVKSVLARSGFLESTSAASSRSCSNSHAIDPVVFHQLELEHQFNSGALRWLWNRKLLFHLVQELLGDALASGDGRQCRTTGCGGCGGDRLLRQLWGEIRSFPAADCRVLSDIDALVASDLPPASAARRLLQHPAVAAEAEAVAAAAAAAVLDSLLEETAASLLA